MSVILETERLILRRFVVEDASFLLTLVNDPTWLKYIGDRNVHTLQEAEQYLLQGAIESYNTNGFGFYIVLLKDSLIPIGTCGLAQRTFLDTPDFGFAFLPDYTGMGLAYEVASANLKYAKEVLGLEELVAITIPENRKSIRLLEKLGFWFDKALLENGEKICLYRYR
jgi:RimJ/RimL family protein N-acetyltransferase